MTFSTALAIEEGQSEKAQEVQKSFARCKVAIALAFVLNIVVVAIPGRMDLILAKEDWPGNGVVSYATPALYAFAIWGAIYLTELIFVIWQGTRKADAEAAETVELIRAVVPGWCAGHSFQALWCLTYRNYLFSFGLFWIPAVFLTMTALSLGVAHRAAAGAAGLKQLLVLAPITMHFGWTTAAGLLNWNQWVTLGYSSLTVRLAALGFSLTLAVLAGVALILTRRTVGYACTLAWAVIALGVQAWSSDIMAAELGADGARTLALVELTVGVGLAVVGVGAKVVLTVRGSPSAEQ